MKLCRHSEKGFTLVEFILAVAVIGIIGLAVDHLASPILKFFQRSGPRQAANMEARRCLETIDRFMSDGVAATLDVSSLGPTDPQNSVARFQTVDGSTCTITWSPSPAASVHFFRRSGGGAAVETLLATHVSNLSFGFDIRDPALVKVTFAMRVPMDASGSPESFYAMPFPDHFIHMAGS